VHSPRAFFLLPWHICATVVDKKEMMLPLSGVLTKGEFPEIVWRWMRGSNLELHKVHYAYKRRIPALLSVTWSGNRAACCVPLASLNTILSDIYVTCYLDITVPIYL
jgi:hypothetical protein